MSSHVAWTDIRAEHVARAGGEDAVDAGKRQMLAEVLGHRLAEVRRARGLTQRQVADRMGVTKGRISQIERGKVSGHDVLARYATALGGRLHQAIYSTSTTATSPPSRNPVSPWTPVSVRARSLIVVVRSRSRMSTRRRRFPPGTGLSTTNLRPRR
jgi:transcriptional regulator with XRE-family HTH domain